MPVLHQLQSPQLRTMPVPTNLRPQDPSHGCFQCLPSDPSPGKLGKEEGDLAVGGLRVETGRELRTERRRWDRSEPEPEFSPFCLSSPPSALLRTTAIPSLRSPHASLLSPGHVGEGQADQRRPEGTGEGRAQGGVSRAGVQAAAGGRAEGL